MAQGSIIDEEFAKRLYGRLTDREDVNLGAKNYEDFRDRYLTNQGALNTIFAAAISDDPSNAVVSRGISMQDFMDRLGGQPIGTEANKVDVIENSKTIQPEPTEDVIDQEEDIVDITEETPVVGDIVEGKYVPPTAPQQPVENTIQDSENKVKEETKHNEQDVIDERTKEPSIDKAQQLFDDAFAIKQGKEKTDLELLKEREERLKKNRAAFEKEEAKETLNKYTTERERKLDGLYNDNLTTLSPEEEIQFQNWWNSNKNVLAWKQQFRDEFNEEPSLTGYDYRGAFKAGIVPEPIDTHITENGEKAYHWESKGLFGKDLKPKGHETLWKTDWMEAFGTDPDEVGMTREKAIPLIDEKRKELLIEKLKSDNPNSVEDIITNRPLTLEDEIESDKLRKELSLVQKNKQWVDDYINFFGQNPFKQGHTVSSAIKQLKMLHPNYDPIDLDIPKEVVVSLEEYNKPSESMKARAEGGYTWWGEWMPPDPHGARMEDLWWERRNNESANKRVNIRWELEKLMKQSNFSYEDLSLADDELAESVKLYLENKTGDRYYNDDFLMAWHGVKQMATQQSARKYTIENRVAEIARENGISTTGEDRDVIKQIQLQETNKDITYALGQMSESQREMFTLTDERNRLTAEVNNPNTSPQDKITKMNKIAALNKQLKDMRGNLQELYDVGTGEWKHVEKEEAQEYNDEIKTVQEKYKHRPTDLLVRDWQKAMSTLKHYEFLFNEKMRYTTYTPGDQPKIDDRWTSARALYNNELGDFYTRIAVKTGTASERTYNSRLSNYQEAVKEFDALNRMLMLNIDPASYTTFTGSKVREGVGGFFETMGEAAVEQLGFDINSESDIAKRSIGQLKSMGVKLSKDQEEVYEEDLSTSVAQAMGTSIPIMVDIITSAMMLRIPIGAGKALFNATRGGQWIKNTMTQSYGRAGRFVYNTVSGGLEGALIFGAAQSDILSPAMGFGEGAAAKVVGSLNIAGKFSKYGKLLDLAARIGAGTTAEFMAEFSGQFTHELERNGYRWGEAFDVTFGETQDEFVRKVATTGIVCMMFSTAFNAKAGLACINTLKRYNAPTEIVETLEQQYAQLESTLEEEGATLGEAAPQTVVEGVAAEPVMEQTEITKDKISIVQSLMAEGKTLPQALTIAEQSTPQELEVLRNRYTEETKPKEEVKPEAAPQTKVEVKPEEVTEEKPTVQPTAEPAVTEEVVEVSNTSKIAEDALNSWVENKNNTTKTNAARKVGAALTGTQTKMISQEQANKVTDELGIKPIKANTKGEVSLERMLTSIEKAGLTPNKVARAIDLHKVDKQAAKVQSFAEKAKLGTELESNLKEADKLIKEGKTEEAGRIIQDVEGRLGEIEGSSKASTIAQTLSISKTNLDIATKPKVEAPPVAPTTAKVTQQPTVEPTVEEVIEEEVKGEKVSMTNQAKNLITKVAEEVSQSTGKPVSKNKVNGAVNSITNSLNKISEILTGRIDPINAYNRYVKAKGDIMTKIAELGDAPSSVNLRTKLENDIKAMVDASPYVESSKAKLVDELGRPTTGLGFELTQEGRTKLAEQNKAARDKAAATKKKTVTSTMLNKQGVDSDLEIDNTVTLKKDIPKAGLKAGDTIKIVGVSKKGKDTGYKDYTFVKVTPEVTEEVEVKAEAKPKAEVKAKPKTKASERTLDNKKKELIKSKLNPKNKQLVSGKREIDSRISPDQEAEVLEEFGIKESIPEHHSISDMLEHHGHLDSAEKIEQTVEKIAKILQKNADNVEEASNRISKSKASEQTAASKKIKSIEDNISNIKNQIEAKKKALLENREALLSGDPKANQIATDLSREKSKLEEQLAEELADLEGWMMVEAGLVSAHTMMQNAVNRSGHLGTLMLITPETIEFFKGAAKFVQMKLAEASAAIKQNGVLRGIAMLPISAYTKGVHFVGDVANSIIKGLGKLLDGFFVGVLKQKHLVKLKKSVMDFVEGLSKKTEYKEGDVDYGLPSSKRYTDEINDILNNSNSVSDIMTNLNSMTDFYGQAQVHGLTNDLSTWSAMSHALVKLRNIINEATEGEGKITDAMLSKQGVRRTLDVGNRLTIKKDIPKLNLKAGDKIEIVKVNENSYNFINSKVRWINIVRTFLKKETNPNTSIFQDSNIGLYSRRQSRLGAKAKSELLKMVFGHSGTIKTWKAKAGILSQQMSEELTENEKIALTFVMQGSTNISEQLYLSKPKRAEINNLIQNPSQSMVKFVPKIDAFLKDAAKALIELNVLDERVLEKENYFPSRYDISEFEFITKPPAYSKKGDVKTVHQKRKRFETFNEAIESGMQPLTLDVTQLLRLYTESVAEPIAQANMITSLMDNAMIDGKPILMVEGDALIPSSWKKWYKNKGIKTTNLSTLIRTKDGKFVPKEIILHPDAYNVLKGVIGKGKGRKAALYEVVNNMMKRSNLMLSGFHPFALTETLLATPNAFLRGMKYGGNPLKLFTGFKNKDFLALQDEAKFTDAVEHGLIVEASPDVSREMAEEIIDQIEDAFKSFEGKNPLLGWFPSKGTSAFKKASSRMDTFLWDYMHNNFKLVGYEELVHDGLKKMKLDENTTEEQAKELIKLVKREAAQHINDTFGGQNWAALKVSPNTMRRAQLFLLSPDWTISTTRQALSVLSGVKHTKVARLLKDNGERGDVVSAVISKGLDAIDPSLNAETAALKRRWGFRFWSRAALMYYLGLQMMNLLTTKHLGDDDEGHFTWGNDYGHRGFHLYFGRRADGGNRYIKFGKQLTELPELWEAPADRLAAKAAPVLQGVYSTLFGETLNRFAIDDPDEKGVGSIIGRGLQQFSLGMLPFTLQSLIKEGMGMGYYDKHKNWGDIAVGLFAPVKKGMSQYTFNTEVEKAIKDNDVQTIVDLVYSARNNNLPVDMKYIKRSFDRVKKDTEEEMVRISPFEDAADLSFEDQIKLERYNKAVDNLYDNLEWEIGGDEELDAKFWKVPPPKIATKQQKEFFGLE